MAFIRRTTRFKREGRGSQLERRGSQLVRGTTVTESSVKDGKTSEQRLIEAAIDKRRILQKRRARDKGKATDSA